MLGHGDPPGPLLGGPPVTALQTAASGTPLPGSTGRTFRALVRAGHPRRRLDRSPLVLDAVFGLINLAGFAILTHWLVAAGPQRAATFGFVAVGIVALLQIQVAAGQTVARTQESLRSGVLEWTLCGPVRPSVVALAGATGPTVQGLIRCVLYLALAIVLLGVPVGAADWWGVTVILVTGTVVTGAVCVLCATAVIALSAGAAVARVLLATLGLVSGVFAPLSQLPAPLAAVGEVLPTQTMVSALRAAMSGAPWVGFWLVLAPSAVLLLVLATVLHRGAVTLARQRGGLHRA